MADRTLDGLRACVASLQTVVAPAVEASGDKLAREQAALIGKYLGFLIERLDYAQDRSRFELARHAEIGAEVARVLADAGETDDGLDAALRTARATLAQDAAAKPALETATAGLQAALGRIVRAAGESRHPLRPAIEKRVLEGSRAIVAMQRAWCAPQAWEIRENAPDIDALLREHGGA